MRHHLSFQGNFTWDKVMAHTGYLDNYAAVVGKLASVQDGNPTMFGNIFGTLELPKFAKTPSYERLLIGGWKLNSVVRLSNGPLVGAPGSVDFIGNYRQPNANLFREFNTCYQTATINTTTNTVTYANQPTTSTVTACDATSPNPAFRQRIAYTSQNNSTVLNIRQPIHPLVDASLFKQFILREGVSFEIRGEFFNLLNTPNFGGPAGLGSATAGSVASATGVASQANDARIGQLTARINF